MRYLSRDAFARTTLLRAVVRPLASDQDCRWCGGVRRTPRAGERFLFRYGTEPDAIRSRVDWHPGEFCSKACHDAYRG